MSALFVEALVENAHIRSFVVPLNKDQLLDIQLLPLYATVASLTIFLLQPRTPTHQFVQKQSRTRKAFILSRLLGCLSLCIPSLPTKQWIQYSIPISCLYATILSILQLSQSNRKATTHSIFIILSIFTVYFQRDIYPLLTTTQTPLDADDPLLYFKLGVVTYTAIIVLLLIPRQYVPVDPEDPMDTPNPEQTASIISLLFYLFLDPIIIKASKLDSLTVDDLPPLADYDRAKYLEMRGVPYLTNFSEKRKGRMVFSLLRVFRKEYTIQLLAIIFEVLTSLGGPIAINRILSYLETGHTTLHPSIWILILFLSPLLYGAAQQVFTFSVNRVSVNAQAVLVMLVFERALGLSVGEGGKKNAKGEEGEGKGEKEGNLIGKLNNLVTTDVNNIVGASHFLLPLFAAPLQICVGIIFLYYILGYSAFVGLFVLLLSAPIPQAILNRVAEVQEEKMRWTDERVKSITEVVSLLRMIKMFAWESKVDNEIRAVRVREVGVLWMGRVWEAVNVTVNSIISALVMLLTFAFYTLVMKEELSASKVFSSTPIFLLIRIQFYRVTKFTQVVRARVSLDRLEGFLSHSEVLASETGQSGLGGEIELRDCEFAWVRKDLEELEFRLCVRGEVVFRKGGVNLIVGPTGAGKTALVMALLGEMHSTPLSSNAYINLPREGGVAYAAQEPWLLHDTIQNNILFGQPYDAERYNKVVRQCALVKDFEMFDAGDGTEVGEMGVTLSGGQKARIALARAIYSRAEILLLDDVFAALDAHTSKWIVERCILGDLVRGRTVLLVTHHVALVRPIAQFVVNIGLDGSVSSETLAPLNYLPSNIDTIEDIIDPEPPTQTHPKSQSDGKLIVAEEVAKGRVGWKAIMFFLSALGGSYPVLFFVILILGFVSTDVTNMYQTWYLGYWGSQYKHGPVNAVYYLSVYSLIAASTVVFRGSRLLHYAVGNIRASIAIHHILVNSILRSTLRWLDETPASRIIARCTHDLGTIDEPLALSFAEVIETVVAAAIRLGSVVVITPVFLVPGVVVAIVGYFAARIYLKAQLPVKREASNAKAPILAHFGATVAGLVSVRAYNVQREFKQELLSRIDNYSRVATLSWDLNRWICARMDFLSAAFSSSLAMYLVFTRSANAANTGFSLNIALEFCTMILLCVRMFNEFEVQSNSLERIQRYTEIDQEKPPTEDGRPPASWPSSGDLRVEGLSARYSANSPEVLHGISFHIRSGERVGVVGRTGSGKSTLTLALLRCILTEGHIYYDGVATDRINLDALRSSITIIPQMPELLSGTLRRNLDPFDEHDDSVLNTALKHAGLFALQEESDEGRITLDTGISSGGSNLSVGQRQIIALARAMVQESKLLILDEATSAIDYKTDALIQDALRSKLGSDVTVITIAHRLPTIMDADKIMVLDAGNLVEFDTPAALLRKEDGIFKGLVDHSGHSEELRAITFGNA